MLCSAVEHTPYGIGTWFPNSGQKAPRAASGRLPSICRLGNAFAQRNCHNQRALPDHDRETSTRQARRVVAGLIERYFFELKRQLANQTEEFWMRISAFTTGTREERVADTVEARQRSDPNKVLPAAGPHAKPELTDDDKTPRAVALPSPTTRRSIPAISRRN